MWNRVSGDDTNKTFFCIINQQLIILQKFNLDASILEQAHLILFECLTLSHSSAVNEASRSPLSKTGYSQLSTQNMQTQVTEFPHQY